MKSQKGFTLIELLVVIAILGILAAIVTPNVVQFIGRGNVEAANTELSSVELAVNGYAADNNGLIPESTDVLTQYINRPLKGSYAISADATVTGESYPGLVWDEDTRLWKK